MRAGAYMDFLALDQCAVLDVEMKMDRGEIPTRVYGGNLQSQPPLRQYALFRSMSLIFLTTPFR